MRKNKQVDVFRFINMHGGDTNVCWEWRRKLKPSDGRPYFVVEGRERPAYAIVLELASGEAQGARVARHSCDNRVCCNPHHLKWGTKQDNSNDMVERERHGMPRTVVRAIKTLLKRAGDKKKTQQTIADLYGVSRETISAIATGRSHKGVK